MTDAKTLGAAAPTCIHRTYSGTAWTNGRPSVLHCVDCGKAMPLSVLSPLLARETELAEARQLLVDMKAAIGDLLSGNPAKWGRVNEVGRDVDAFLARTDTQEEK